MQAKGCPRCNEVVEFDQAEDYDSGSVQLLELVDGALEIVAIWKAESHAQKQWQQEWIRKAKKLGASFDC